MSFDASAYVKKIVASKPAAKGNPIRDGKFVFAIKRMTIKPSDKGSEVWFIAEFMVLTSAAVDVPVDLQALDHTNPAFRMPVTNPNAAGSDCSLVSDLMSQMGPANVKALAAADLGVKHDTINEEQLSKWILDNVDTPDKTWPGIENPKQGRFLGCTTTRSLGKKSPNVGKPYVNLNWEHQPQSAEDLAKARALFQTQAKV